MPFFTSRSIEDFPIGNILLHDHHAATAIVGLHAHPHAWLTPEDLALISSATPTLLDEQHTPLAWLGDSPEMANAVVANSSFIVVHPWDLLRANELYVASLTGDSIHGDIHPNAVIEGTLHLGAGTRILPGV